jgi:hypothetical protein
MEARTSLGRTGISKLFVGVVLVIVAVGLGIMAAYLATSVTATSGASAQPAHAAPGTILRQDNPVQAPALEAEQYAPRMGGVQE